MALNRGSEYQYAPLRSAARDLRLFRFVYPPSRSHSLVELQLKVFGQGSITQRLKVFEQGSITQLTQTRPATDPSYVAVSYEWGPPQPQTEIRVNGASFMVRRNLNDFLKAIEQRYDPIARRDRMIGPWIYYTWSDQVEWFWLDAICIDQKNIEERNAQVPRMHKIFDLAWMTLSWLGPPNEPTIELAFQTIKDTIQIEYALGKWPIQPDDRNIRLDAILKLAHHSYWTRRWVVQEILVSGDVLLSNGNSELGWNKIEDLFNIAESEEQAEAHDVLLHSELSNSPLFKLVLDRLGKHFRSRMLFPISKLLTEFTSTKCELVHDKVYALLTLASDSEGIVVDYSCPLEELLCQSLCQGGWEDRSQIRTIVTDMGFASSLPQNYLGNGEVGSPQTPKPIIIHEKPLTFRRISNVVEIHLPDSELETVQGLRSQPLMTEIADSIEFLIGSNDLDILKTGRLSWWIELDQMRHARLIKFYNAMKTYRDLSPSNDDHSSAARQKPGREITSSSLQPDKMIYGKIITVLICDDGRLALGCNLARPGDIICSSIYLPEWNLVIRPPQQAQSQQQSPLAYSNLIGKATFGGEREEAARFLSEAWLWSIMSSCHPVELAEREGQSPDEFNFKLIDYRHDEPLAGIEKELWLRFAGELRTLIDAIICATFSSCLSERPQMHVKYNMWDLVELARGYRSEVPLHTVNRI